MEMNDNRIISEDGHEPGTLPGQAGNDMDIHGAQEGQIEQIPIPEQAGNDMDIHGAQEGQIEQIPIPEQAGNDMDIHGAQEGQIEQIPIQIGSTSTFAGKGT
jgi:hypothetical protein